MKIAIFYYTQTGQALNTVKSICAPIEASAANTVIYKQIVPTKDYPFPWSKNEFFDVFPETRLGIPPTGIQPMDLTDIADADLVMVSGQSWFLSPSQPIQAFFLDGQVKSYLRGRDVVFVNSCRNMWLMTKQKVRKYIEGAGARMVGHIVLQDETENLISVLTVIRWLVYGKKEATGMLPASGVSQKDIDRSKVFGRIILDTYSTGEAIHLQQSLLAAGAIHYKPSVLYLERVGHRLFWFWAKFIRQKGEYGNPKRIFRDNFFYIYLLLVLFLISPFAQLVFYLTYPLHRVCSTKRVDCNI